jgi:2-polyprenyl-6-methoxyphenol hydroxylase-like FAD-dependent oxidoreductase
LNRLELTLFDTF